MNKLVTLSLLILVLGSCTIQKRLYTGGYSIDFHSKHKSVKSDPEAQPTSAKAVKPEVRNIESVLDTDTTLVDKMETAESPDTAIRVEKSLPFEKKVVKRTSAFVKKTIPFRALETKQKMTELKGINQQHRMSSPSISDWDVDWGAWIGFIVLVAILILYFAYPTFALVVEAILAIAMLIGLICIIFWLFSALGNFEWFWSGR